ncbi:hypothetical protein V5O48_014380 [Marasmius crinis-equi]|uniref:Uncharacterized protein n=1 Tax=Marasmius crinis-equi TaxID=585013 RepID=A0ABR3EXG0_9AGAR
MTIQSRHHTKLLERQRLKRIAEQQAQEEAEKQREKKSKKLTPKSTPKTTSKADTGVYSQQSDSCSLLIESSKRDLEEKLRKLKNIYSGQIGSSPREYLNKLSGEADATCNALKAFEQDVAKIIDILCQLDAQVKRLGNNVKTRDLYLIYHNKYPY